MTEDGQFPGMGDSQRKIKNDPYLIGTPWRWNLAGGRGRSWARGRRSRSSGGANIWGRLSRTRPCRRTRGTCRDTSQSCSRHGTSTRRRWCADFPTFLASIPGKSKSARQGPPPLSRPEPEAQASRGEEFHSRPGRSRGGWCKWSRSRGPRASSRCRDPLWKAATKRIKSWTFLLWRRNAVFISYRFVCEMEVSAEKSYKLKNYAKDFCTSDVSRIINCYDFYVLGTSAHLSIFAHIRSS